MTEAASHGTVPHQYHKYQLHVIINPTITFGRVLNIFRRAFASFVKSSHKPCNNNQKKNFYPCFSDEATEAHISFFSFFFGPSIQSFSPPLHTIVLLSDNPFGQPGVYSSKFVSIVIFSSVPFSHSVLFDSLQSHESQHARPPGPSPTPGVHSNSRPSSQ